MQQEPLDKAGRLNRALSFSNIALWDWDRKTNHVVFSDRMEIIHGYAKGTFPLTFSKFIDVVHPDDKELFTRVIKNAMENGLGYEVEYRIVTPASTIRWVCGKTEIIKGMDGSFEGLSGYVIDITENKKSESQLIYKQEKYKLLLENAPESIILLDRENKIVYCNYSLFLVFGYEPDELVGHPIASLQKEAFRKDDKQGLDRCLETTFKSKNWEFIETIAVAKDGREFPIEISLSHMVVQGNHYFAAFIKDISARKKADKAIIESEARFRAMTNATPLGIFVLDSNLKTTYLNKAATEITGLSKDEYEEKGFGHIIHPEDKDDLLNVWSHAIQNLIPFEQTSRLIKGNKVVWIHVILAPINEKNINIGFVGTIEEITKKKEVEDDLKATSERLHMSLKSSKTGTWYVDMLKNTTAWDDYMYPLFGFSSNDENAVPEFFQMLHEEDSDKMKKAIEIAIQTRSGYDEEYRVRWPDGSIHFLASRGEVYYDDNGKPIRMVGTCWDITDRKLNDEKFKQQYKELEKVNKELDQFVYIASHDLKAPLRSLLGLLQISRRETNPEHLKLNFDHMEKSILRLDGFILDILNYSKNSRLNVEHTLISFKDIVQEIFENLMYIEEVNRLNIMLRIDDSLVFYSDKDRLKVVLSNLISNAIKYHNYDQENPEIILEIYSDHNKVIIKVEDNGKGIGQEQVGKIFEMFYKASETSVGSGLGLYIVHEIIIKLHGTISVKSSLGQGSTFTLELESCSNLDPC